MVMRGKRKSLKNRKQEHRDYSMPKFDLSSEERDFFALVAENLKEKGLTHPSNFTLTNVKQAMLEVRDRQQQLATMFCNNEEFAQAVVLKVAKDIYDGTLPVQQRVPRYTTWTETDMRRFLKEYLNDVTADVPGISEGYREDHPYTVTLSGSPIPCSEICVRFHCRVWEVHVSEAAVKRNGWKCREKS